MNLKLAFLIIVISAKTCGNENKNFICVDGNTIALKQVCDGLENCTDGSDETANLCYHIICPPDMFRCYYGACINKSARCDKKYHCADHSDESHCGHALGSCDNNEFQCLSRECIPNEKICDGVPDCSDKSDEGVNICNELPCPENTYHCKHGGCIHLDACCNGFWDCVDGSDESDLLCRNLNCSRQECATVYEPTFCPPINSSRIIIKCKSELGHKGWVPCNQPMPIGTVAEYECKPYYQPSNSIHANNMRTVCQPDGTWSREYLKCEPECGRTDPIVMPLIVHGWILEKGRWPWHAILYSLQNGNWVFSCGGNLISEKIILTAAHCVWKTTPDTIKVAVGHYKKEYNDTDDFSQILDVQEIVIQPVYQDILGNYGSDIAILILNEPVEFSPFVLPVCVDWELHDISAHLSGNSVGMIVGMGITENDTFSDRLRATFLPAVSDDTCINAQTRDFKKYVTYTSFCAGWLNGTGVCNGDSGGGLVFQQGGQQGLWVLQGIVSVSPRRLGTPFCDPKYYTIFIKVGMYVNWIKTVLNKIQAERGYDIQNNIL